MTPNGKAGQAAATRELTVTSRPMSVLLMCSAARSGLAAAPTVAVSALLSARMAARARMTRVRSWPPSVRSRCRPVTRATWLARLRIWLVPDHGMPGPTLRSRWTERVTGDLRPGGAVRPVLGAAYFLVSQKILSISAIWARRLSATAVSVVFLASPAALVAFQNRSCSWGNCSR